MRQLNHIGVSATEELKPITRETRDVVVVGGGTAAFEAAVAAAQVSGSSVVLVEKASQPEFGGNARFSHTGFRFAHRGSAEIRQFLPNLSEAAFGRMVIPPYDADTYLSDLDRVTDGRIDRPLAETLARRSNEVMHWMLDCGIEWEPNAGIDVDGRYHFEPGMPLQAAGGVRGGQRQLARWREVAGRLGVDIRFESPVVALHGDSTRVEGVMVRTPEREYDIEAQAVILCTGGFQASREMVARHLGKAALRAKVRGSRHDTGEVLRMAVELGAGTSGDWSGANVTPVDAAAREVEAGNDANRYSYMYGITVNREGDRFFDEGEGQLSYTYAKVGWALLQQPGGVGYQIFDRKGLQLLKTYAYDHAEPVETPTMEELADCLGIARERLVATVNGFNRSIQSEVPFDPSTPDGRGTSAIRPPKSNWAVALDEPPFRAYAVTGGITFTFGGLAISQRAQVLNRDHQPIRGLYASGDILGLFHGGYPSGSGQTRNAVFSWLAGRHCLA